MLNNPETALYYYDGPVIFTCRDADNQLHLAHWANCHSLGNPDGYEEYMVVPFTKELESQLSDNVLSLRDALIREGITIRIARIFWKRCDNGDPHIEYREATPAEIESYVPDQGVMLSPMGPEERVTRDWAANQTRRQ